MSWSAFFQNGNAAYAAKVSMAGNDLTVLDANGRPQTFWKIDQLVPVQNSRTELVLTQRGQPGRLTLQGNDAIGLRRELEQTSAWRDAKSRNWNTRKVIRLVPLAAAIAAAWFFWPAIASWGAKTLPASAETYIGRQMHTRLTAQQTACTGQPGIDILSRLLGRLAHNSSPLDVMVIDDAATPVSLLLPGRRLILSRKTLGDFASADQFAAALAFNMAQADGRVPLRQIIRTPGKLVSTLVETRGDLTATMRNSLPDQTTRLRTGTTYDDMTSARILADAQIGSAGLAALLREQAEARSAAIPENTGTPSLSNKDWQLLRMICDTGDVQDKS